MVIAENPRRSQLETYQIFLRGVRWQTFKQLLAGIGETPDYGIDYTQNVLEIKILPPTENPAQSGALPVQKTAPIVTFKGVSWETYEALMSDVGDDRAWRIAYDGSALEIRTPLIEHEEPKGLLECFVEVVADELEIEVRKLGALTLQREDLAKAIEPDSCFYIQNELRIRGKTTLDLRVDPPPDLAIEADYTNSSINKFAIYAGMGVPELWRYRRKTLQIFHLIDGEYKLRTESLAFPFLPVAEVPNFIESSREIGQRAAVRRFRSLIQEILQQM